MSRFQVAKDVLLGRTDIHKLKADLEKAYAENDALAKQIRQIDDELFKIQTGDPKALSKLCDAMMLRKTQESKRIEAIMIPELKRTYGR